MLGFVLTLAVRTLANYLRTERNPTGYLSAGDDKEKAMESPKQYLTLQVGEARYGIGIHQVREVVSYTPPSPMPNGSACMLGVINLRGSAVPVLDLRLKFGLEKTIPTVDTCIIILEVQIGGVAVLLGITADMVQQVAEFAQEDLEPPPRMVEGQSVEWIQAMARCEDGFVILLDIDKILAEDGQIALTTDTGRANSSGESPQVVGA